MAHRPFLAPSAVVSTLHDFMPEYYREHAPLWSRESLLGRAKNYYFRRMNRFTLQSNGLVIVPTQTIAQEAVQRYRVPPERVWVTHLAGNADTSETVRVSPKEEFTILYVAGFYPHKGHLYAIEAYEKLWDRSPTLVPRLVFRGHITDRAYYEQVIDRIRQSRYSHGIEVVSYEAKASLGDLYKCASVLLLLSEYEGFGLPLIEAQKYNTIVVCSDIPVFHEIMQSSAVYVRQDDPDEVADALHKLTLDELHSHRLIEVGTSNCTRFSWHATAAATLDAYSAVSRKRNGTALRSR